MTTETARLLVVAVGKGMEGVKRGLDGIYRSGSMAEKATSGFGRTLVRFAGPAAVAAGALAGLNKVAEVTRSFGILNAQLITSTQSVEEAAKAFDVLQQFAKDTPYGLEQSVTAFTKLVNYGLDPSQRAMVSYGNTAAAMSKDLDQMIEAVADAATGEFERLKEFGIKARNNGDTISFSFRGTTTTVKNNAEEIEGYLIKLGENNFGDAMSNRMKTLDGAIANLEDNWYGLWLNISKTGLGDIITKQTQEAGDSIQGLSDMFASGQIQMVWDEWVNGWEAAGVALQNFFNISDSNLETWGNNLSKFFSEQWAMTIDQVLEFPENLANMINTTKLYLSDWADSALEYGQEFYLWLKKYIGGTAALMEAFNKQLTSFVHLDGFDKDAFVREVNDYYAGVEKEQEEFYKNKATRQKRQNQEEYDEELRHTIALATMGTAREKGRQATENQQRESYDLGKYKVKGDGSGSNSTSKKKGGGLTADSWETYFQSIQQGAADTYDKLDLKEKQELEKVQKYLKAGVTSQKEAQEAITLIHEKYAKERQDFIDKYDPFAEASNKLKEDLKNIQQILRGGGISPETADYQTRKSQADYFDTTATATGEQAVSPEDSLRGRYDPIQEAQNSYDQQLAILDAFHEAGYTKEEDYQKKRHELYSKMLSEQQAYQLSDVNTYLDSATSLATGLADVIGSFGDKASASYKVAYALSRSFAVAQASLNFYLALSQAMADPTAVTLPQKLANYSAVAASGGALLSSIAAVGMAHDGIDSVPKTGTWILEKGERVVTNSTSRKLDKTLDDVSNNRGGDSGGNMVYSPNVTVPVTIQGNPDERTMIMMDERIKKSVKEANELSSQQLASGRGNMAKAMKAWNVNRKTK